MFYAGHLGVILYEYLGEEYPEVLGRPAVASAAVHMSDGDLQGPSWAP